ncbi:MAG: sigma-70 family RNA polymerase sigma factor [Bacteroidetes bacterium]|nr:sigma-70 family RNA polymerase sigma factor [Bacteroidota bacterium]MBU1373464.1 sigma-70 family RNA polymerase sigma factor [Bacteroidota bacterium]MBU1485222.1 sigma-70 family RNA polymerase sigma factor [Bacteroidota bacterium]MBU1761413.1 sigma-70 family RNA polymerase sigma factor [Bacteroidota bacterium]MBU2045486.1 sigma-70 family RNA polymerase sigma factor [Bacteroidota bacterium]
MQNKNSDIEIIDAVLAGNQSAYAELVKRNQRYVFTLALRFTRSREDAEEVAQDTFVKAYRSLSSYQRTAKFSTWLYTIVYNTSMTYLRKKRLDVSSIDDEGTAIQLESYGLADDLSVERKSRSFYVNKAIENLLPDDATIINLFYLGEQSLEEISQIMGMEANTIKVKLHRARQRLKNQLEIILGGEVKDLI